MAMLLLKKSYQHKELKEIKFNELWNGIIHPTPFSDGENSTRATKALILMFLNGIIILRYIFDKRSLWRRCFRKGNEWH